MSNAEPEERVTASSDGVTVEKSFEPDDFPVPAIAFVIRSEREETVAVRMVDSVPEHVTPEDIGFHPKYGAEFWGVDGDAIVFEREFEPGEEYTTVYGLRGGDADDVEKYMSDPVLETVHPPLEDSEESEDVVRDVIEGDDEDDAAPETDAEAQDDIESAIREADTAEETASEPEIEESPESTDATEVDESDEPDDSEPTDESHDGRATAVAAEGSLAAALAAEIRDGEVDDEDLDELRDALGVEADAGEAASSGAVDARIERLQSEVADLQAYTDALESFLDENGDAQTLIEEYRTELDDAVERIEDVDGRIDSTLEDVETRVEEATDEIEETIEERVTDHVEELRSDIEALEEEVEDGIDDERLDAIEEDISDIENELSDVSEMRERLTAAFGAPSDEE